MKNLNEKALICNNCKTENPLFKLHCINCKAYLRDKIYNIDLWSTIFKLIHSPVEAFTSIIQSEHKNYISLILFVATIKIYIIGIISVVQLEITENIFEYFPYDIGIVFIYITTFLFLFSVVLHYIINYYKIETRIKDIFAALVYSLFPFAFSLIIFFPIQLILFGEFLFSINPSPFIIKPLPAYVLSGIEGIIILWIMVLFITAIYTQTKNKLFSVISGLIIIPALFSGFIFLASLTIS